MIKIEIYTLPVGENGPERQQIADSLAAIGFFRPEDLTTSAPGVVGHAGEVGRTADEAPAEDKPKTRGRPKKDAPKAEPPADPAPAEAAQDAADEQAEATSEKPDGDEPAGAPKVYDINDMRAAGKAYADAYGMPATLKDIPGIIGFQAFSQVPEGQIDAVTRLVLQAVEQNPHNHPKV